MTILSRNKTLAAALLATATFALPAAVQAQNYHSSSRVYENCKQADTENQILGGIIGAIAGGVVGSQVSGNGARTEGSAIGAAVGAAAGATIAGDKRNCKREARRASNSGVYYTSGSNYRSSPTRSYRGGSSHGTTYGSSRTYGNGYSAVHHGGSGYGYDNGYRGTDRVQRIKYKIDGLRAERRRLEERQRYRYRPHRADKIAAIGEEIRRLKKRKRRVKDRIKSSRYYR